MSRFLFATTAYPAHIDWGGLLATASCLARQGHAVLWASDLGTLPALQRAPFESCTIPVVDPHRQASDLDAHGDRSSMAQTWRGALRPDDAACVGAPTPRERLLLVRMLLSAWLQEPALVACCDALGRLVDDWRPDVIVGEPLMLPASIVADARQIPLAGCGYPGALLSLDSMPELDRALHHVGALLARVRERAGCKNHAGPQLFCWSDELQLVFFPPEWYATLRAPSSANAQYVGALPWRRTAAGDGDVRPLIVVASSSSYAPDPQILENIFAAVDAAGGRVLTAGHESTRPLFEPLPAHVQWERWIDYEAVLPRARAIIQHGGLGTTHAAARAALPQLVLPGPIDQVLHAEAVARFGAGINYVGPLTPEALVPLVRDLLEAASYATQAATLQERFAACGGVPRAAELLVQHARGRGRNDALDVGRFDASRTA